MESSPNRPTPPKSGKIPPLWRRTLTVTLTVTAVLFVIYIAYLLRRPLIWVMIAAFLAVALAGPINWLSQRMPHKAAIATTYAALLIVPLIVLAIILPPLVREATDFAAALPSYGARFQAWVEDNGTLRDLDEKYGIADKIEDAVGQFPNKIGDAAQFFASLGIGVVNSAFAAVTILILSVFLAANGRNWLDFVLKNRLQGDTESLRLTLDQMGRTVSGYVAGALLQAVVAGITTFIVLSLLGVPFAAALAVLVALFDLIPMVGATIAAVLVGVITLFSDFPVDTIVWIIWAVVYQQVENTVIQPRIQSRTVGVHPFVVILSVLFGGTLFGVVGAILSVPVAAMVQIAIRDWAQWKTTRLSVSS